MSVETRIWVPYESHFAAHIDVPEEVLNTFNQKLGVPGINYWSEVVMLPDNRGEVSGLIVMRVWYSKEKYERRKDPILEVPIGYWHDHPILGGRWCYYFGLGDIYRFLQRALMDAERKMSEIERISESESESEDEGERESEDP